ncbi:MAG: hypothetical protein ACI9EF_001187 [Pseudohongiellaceae bacterium]|jgi:hypothetical protein
MNDGDGRFDECWPWVNVGADIKLHTLDIDLVDLDSDFDLDVFASIRNSQARVYRNNLQADGSFPSNAFSDITQTALLNTGATLSGTCNYEMEFGDVDGDFDVYAKNYAGFQDRILRNNGNLTFDMFDWIQNDPNQDENECDFLDFDNDGDLDVFMANFSGTNNLFVSGLAQGMSGVDLYHRAGVAGGLYPHPETPTSGNGGTTLDGECADMDGDGDTDILLSNDGNQQNRY